jgi:hypothetical protein
MELRREKPILKGGMPNEGKCLIVIKYSITTNHKNERKNKMENIFKISKRGIIAILTLCILLSIAGTGLNVTAMAVETIAPVEETAVATEETAVATEGIAIPTQENTVAIDETTLELMPMMASGCENDYNHIFGNPAHNLDGFVGYYGGNQAAAYAAVSVAAQAYVTSHQITGIINAFNQITINVSGFNITFRGNVMNGNLHIGTFFII